MLNTSINLRTFFILSTLVLSAYASRSLAQTVPGSNLQNPVQQKYQLPFQQNHVQVLEQAKKLGAPMVAVDRALKEAEKGNYSKKDVITVFDLSQTSNAKRFYMLDFKSGKTTSYHVSHGKGNGEHLRASRFKGFNNIGSEMTPLGALKATFTSFLDGYQTVEDTVVGKTYHNLVIIDLVGMKSYNSNIRRDAIWVVGHSKWYVTEGYRKQNGGLLGRSLGCIVLDPIFSNEVFYRIQGGSLMYITVGNDPIEKYL